MNDRRGRRNRLRGWNLSRIASAIEQFDDESRERRPSSRECRWYSRDVGSHLQHVGWDLSHVDVADWIVACARSQGSTDPLRGACDHHEWCVDRTHGPRDDCHARRHRWTRRRAHFTGVSERHERARARSTVRRARDQAASAGRATRRSSQRVERARSTARRARGTRSFHGLHARRARWTGRRDRSHGGRACSHGRRANSTSSVHEDHSAVHEDHSTIHEDHSTIHEGANVACSFPVAVHRRRGGINISTVGLELILPNRRSCHVT